MGEAQSGEHSRQGRRELVLLAMRDCIAKQATVEPSWTYLRRFSEEMTRVGGPTARR